MFACLLALEMCSLWLRLIYTHVVYYMCIHYGTVMAAKYSITVSESELFLFLLMSPGSKQFQIGYRQYLKWNRYLIFFQVWEGGPLGIS